MTTPAKTTEPKHTPEPWRMMQTNLGLMLIASNHGTERSIAQLFEPWDRSRADTAEVNGIRVLACVNALAGIASPAEAIEQARKALEEFSELEFSTTDRSGHVECRFCGCCLDYHVFLKGDPRHGNVRCDDGHAPDCLTMRGRAALLALTPKPGTTT